MSDFNLGFDFLFAQSWQSLVAIFWYTILFEIPRYGLAFAAIACAPFVAKLWNGEKLQAEFDAAKPPVTTSVIIVGHNEADSLERCVRSLREQSLKDIEIVIVSDGSSDRMAAVASRLVKEGLAERALATDLRGGKSSGVNLAIKASTGNIVVNVDCDCSFDRMAIENILKPFEVSAIGAACGDIVPRNGNASLVARFQEIEYLFTLSVGKRIGASVDQVVCVSGAFGAFRREALESIGAFDVGGGEDLDFTLRLRAKGWRVAFADDAVCYTDVPASLWPLIRQRFRWERDAIWIRYRKHRRLMDPRWPRFRLAEAFHQWDFLLFSVVGAVVFPFYIVWLYLTYGMFATSILVAMQVGLCVIDIAMLAIAAFVTGRPAFWRNLPYLFGYSLFASYVMRLVRLWAYIEEWFLSRSRRDNYTPLKVRDIRKW
jgi:cellulose synthase/poly-beta-1,6-N-acetylglucosamine synthase-like glycosyltransferase